MTKPSTLFDYAERISRVRSHLESHLDDPCQPAELAQYAALSVHHFHRVFRGMVGESVLEHVRRLRLERAARQLRQSQHTQTDGSILEIALSAGYNSHEAFTRAFQQHFGISPSLYRLQPNQRVYAYQQEKQQQPLPRVVIQQHPRISVAAVRHIGPWDQVGRAFDTLMQCVSPYLRDPTQGPPQFYGLCADDPDITPAHALRFDAAIASTCFANTQTNTQTNTHANMYAGPVRAVEIPAGRYACLVHTGLWSTLSVGYLDLIGRWAPAVGAALCDEPTVEVYLDGPDSPIPPAQRRTEIRVRLQDHSGR